MQTFKVGIHYTEIGYVTIDANNVDEAEKKIQKILEDDGIYNLNVKCTNREYEVTDVKTIPLEKKEKPWSGDFKNINFEKLKNTIWTPTK